MYLSLKKIKFSSKFYLIIFIFIYLLLNFYQKNLVFAMKNNNSDLIPKKSNDSEMIDIKILDKYSETENETKEIIISFKKFLHRIRIIQEITQQNINKLIYTLNKMKKIINILETNNKNLEDENKKLREEVNLLKNLK
ncbi:hypothetical protein BBA70_00755 [New Jersey aster yellows phytoplasma]|uniref:Effector n=3 Tax=16SrI (Aster yellows group) TaxID=3042590 RepID=A0ABX4K0R8_9MOLU|nr:hypothetical protein BBA70_00755 [New Jersey aster yellows phytoplasma]